MIYNASHAGGLLVFALGWVWGAACGRPSFTVVRVFEQFSVVVVVVVVEKGWEAADLSTGVLQVAASGLWWGDGGCRQLSPAHLGTTTESTNHGP